MRLFEFADYRDFLRHHIAALPQQGRGFIGRLSEATRINHSIVSQVLSGDRDFTPEQAASVGEFLKLSRSEQEYFVLLVLRARAGNPPLRELLDRQLAEHRRRDQNLHDRLPVDRDLTDAEKAVYYSTWHYAAAHVMSSLPGVNTVELVSERLRMPRERAAQVVQFLVRHDICRLENDRLTPGSRSLHLDAQHPLIPRHHGNWRIRAMERHADIDPGKSEISYSSPMSLSREAAAELRRRIVDFIAQSASVVDSSEPEDAYCMNLDWFRI